MKTKLLILILICLQVQIKGFATSNNVALLSQTENDSNLANLIGPINHSRTVVCGNQKEVVYSVNYNDTIKYKWFVQNGMIISSNTIHYVKVDWNKVLASPGTGIISVEIKNIKGKLLSNLSDTIYFSGNAPDVNDVAAKVNSSGESYMLIYPNPSEEFIYQWYKNDSPILNETGQFYYPSGGLDTAAEYKVFVSPKEQEECGNFAYYKPLIPTSYIPDIQFSLSSGEFFVVSENPNKGNFLVMINEKLFDWSTENIVFSLYSFSGVRVLEQKVETAGVININQNLPQGIYTIMLSIDGKKMDSKKIIVQ